MKIKILISCAGPGFSFVSGDTPDVDKVVADDLVQAGYAEPMEGSKEATEPNVPPDNSGSDMPAVATKSKKVR